MVAALSFAESRMKGGMFKPTNGYEILLNGRGRSFRDLEEVAIYAARELAGRQGNNLVQVRHPDGKLVTVTQDGSLEST